MKTKILLTKTCIVLFGLQIVFAWQLPLQEVSDPICKKLHREDHTPSCKKPFTLPSTTRSSDFTENEKLIFSVGYKGSYTHPHSDAGWHLGIDIVSAKGTPVYAVADGRVTRAEEAGGYGNTIVIKHHTDDWVIYSDYAHLDIMWVARGDEVKEWQKIWEVGNSWFSIWPYGNHLEFQITTSESPTHPYGHSVCPFGYWDAVQKGLCVDIWEKYAIDPLAFLMEKINGTIFDRSEQKQEEAIIASPIIKQTSENVEWTVIEEWAPELTADQIIDAESTPIVKDATSGTNRAEQYLDKFKLKNKELATIDVRNINIFASIQKASDPISVSEPTAQDITTRSNPIVASAPATISTDDLDINRLIQKQQTNKTTSDPPAPLQVVGEVSKEVLEVWNYAKVLLDIKELDGTHSHGMISHPIYVRYDDQILDFTTESFQFIIFGKKQLLFKANKTGTTKLEIMAGDTVVKTFEIEVQ